MKIIMNNIKKLFVVLLSIILCFCFVGCKTKTPEEKAKEEAEYEERMEQDKISTTHSYEVVDVFQYVKKYTNGYGGIKKTEIMTGFSYIDDNGKIQIEDDWYGDIIISDENKYVYCDSDYFQNRFRELYVTKDMMAKIQVTD